MSNEKFIRTLRAHAPYYIPRLSSAQRLLLLFTGHVKIDINEDGKSSFNIIKCKKHGLVVTDINDDRPLLCPYCYSCDHEDNDNEEEEDIFLSHQMTENTIVELSAELHI